MTVAALYDIHGNLPALEAVLEEIVAHDVDRVVVGGDVVPGPMPGQCLRLLADLPVPTDFIHGNGEREVLAVRNGEPPGDRVPASVHDVLRWVAAELTDEEARHLASWPPTHARAVPGVGDVLFCHGTPRSDEEIVTRLTPDERLHALFDGHAADVIVCGHTHMQFERTVGDVRLVNAGSVGMVFGEPGADWLLLGPDIELRRTAYDLEAAAERIRGTAYPGAGSFAANNVLQPPSAEEMTAILEGST